MYDYESAMGEETHLKQLHDETFGKLTFSCEKESTLPKDGTLTHT